MRITQSRSGWVGLFLGLAAATVGLEPLAGPIRPWHLFILVAVAISITTSSPAKSRVHGVEWALFAYVAIRAVTELINSVELHYSIDWGTLVYPLWWWLAFVAAKRVVADLTHATTMLRAICVPFLVTVPLAVLQALGVGIVLQLTAQFVDSEGLQARLLAASQIRAVGLVGHWTHWGVYCAAVLTVGFALLVLARRHRIGGVVYPLVVVFAGLLGLASSITFAPVLIVIVVAMVSFRRIGLSLPTVAAIGAGVAGAVIFLGADLEERLTFQATGTSKVPWIPDWVPSTIGYRVYIWTTETIPMISDRLTTGWGLNVYEGAYPATMIPGRTYPSELRWISAESQWFAELMSSGILGLSGLILVLVTVVSLLRGVRERAVADLVAPVGAFVFALVIAASTAPMVTNKGAPLILWPVLGAIFALRLGAEKEEDSQSRRARSARRPSASRRTLRG